MRAKFVNRMFFSKTQNINNKIWELGDFADISREEMRLPYRKEVPANKRKEVETLLKELYDGKLPSGYFTGEYGDEIS